METEPPIVLPVASLAPAVAEGWCWGEASAPF